MTPLNFRIHRGKRIDTEEWIEGYLMYDAADNEAFIKEEGTWELHKVIPETVGMYTGEEDIFEGDIIRGLNTQLYAVRLGDYVAMGIDGEEDSFVGFYLEPITGMFTEAFGTDAYKWCKKLGNVYDDPDLLKGGKAK